MYIYTHCRCDTMPAWAYLRVNFASVGFPGPIAGSVTLSILMRYPRFRKASKPACMCPNQFTNKPEGAWLTKACPQSLNYISTMGSPAVTATSMDLCAPVRNIGPSK